MNAFRSGIESAHIRTDELCHVFPGTAAYDLLLHGIRVFLRGIVAQIRIHVAHLARSGFGIRSRCPFRHVAGHVIEAEFVRSERADTRSDQMAVFRIVAFARFEVAQEATFSGSPARSPAHGYLFSFLPVRAAYSHSPSVGRRNGSRACPLGKFRDSLNRLVRHTRMLSPVPRKRLPQDNRHSPDARNTYAYKVRCKHC